MGAERVLLATLITAGSGLLGVALAKCKCMYKRDSEGNCSTTFALNDKSIQPDDHEIEVCHEHVGNEIPVLILTKKARAES